MSGINNMTDKIEGTECERPLTLEEALAHDKDVQRTMLGRINMPEGHNLSQVEIWIAEQLKFLEILTTNVNNGQFPSKDDYKTFFGLDYHISEKYPGFHKISVCI